MRLTFQSYLVNALARCATRLKHVSVSNRLMYPAYTIMMIVIVSCISVVCKYVERVSGIDV